jgi:hypothetical protein
MRSVKATACHGVELFAGTPRYATKYDSWDAVCGRRVKVLLTQRFDTVDPSACESCVRVLSEAEGRDSFPPTSYLLFGPSPLRVAEPLIFVAKESIPEVMIRLTEF